MKWANVAFSVIASLAWIYIGAKIFILLWPLKWELAIAGVIACVVVSVYMIDLAIEAAKS